MISTPQTAAEFEKQALAKLRTQYINEGFDFIEHPDRNHLPQFLGSYRPDAVAMKPGAKIAIEVKGRYSPKLEQSLQSIRQLFEGHPDWKFIVSYAGDDGSKYIDIPPASPDVIRLRMQEVHKLSISGHRRASFILAWALLEASLHRLDSERGKRPRTPATVVQTLAMLGYLTPAKEQRLRSLIELRNRIVHGDVEVEPSLDEVREVLEAVNQTLL